MKRTLQWLVPRLAVVLGSSVLALAGAEWALRTVEPLDPYEIVSDRPDGLSLYQPHPSRGRSLNPGFTGHFVHPDYGGEQVLVNRLGFRDRGFEVSIDASAERVVVLGDSLTFGLGVLAEESFSSVLEELLEQRTGARVQVFNTGVSGYGPGQELAVLREERARLLPQVAILALYMGNDIEDAFLAADLEPVPFPELSALLDGRGPEEARGSVPDFREYREPAARGRVLLRRSFWNAHSVLLRRVFRVADNLAIRWRLKEPEAVINYFMLSTLDRNLQLPAASGLGSVLAGIGACADAMTGEGSLVVLLIPSKFQTEPETMRRHARLLGLAEGRFDAAQPERIIARYCAEYGIPVIDLLPPLASAVRAGEAVYFPEGHLNRSGHLMAGEHLVDVVEGLLKGDAPPRVHDVEPH